MLTSQSEVQAFDVSRDGRRVAIMDIEGINTFPQSVFRSAVRLINSEDGREEERWVCVSLVTHEDYLNSLRGGDVCFLEDASSLAVACFRVRSNKDLQDFLWVL